MEKINVGLKGSFTLVVERADGSFDTVHKDNIIVDTGFDFIADAMCASSRPAILNYIGIGTGAVAAVAGNTALGTQNGTRETSTYAHTPGTKTFTLQAVFSNRTAAITEAGIFNAASAGIMFDRVVFAAINLQTADTLTAKFTLTMS